MSEISGSNGTWNYSVVGPPPEAIKLTYFPKPGTCGDIRLSQRVTKTAYDAQGRVVTNDPDEMFRPAQNPFGHAKPDTIRRVLTGDATAPTYIDHDACEGDPYYNGDDPVKDKASPGNAKADPPTPTDSGWDSPGGPMGAVKGNIARIDMEFETCAVCAETGRILGCVRWMCRVTRTGQGKIAVLTKDDDAPASEAFRAAFYRFVQNHTKKDDNGIVRFWCPEGDVKVGGVTIPPWRGPVPDPFRKYWLDMQSRIDVDRGLVGGGPVFGSAREALRACAEAPERSAIKFTWAGFQEKRRPGVVFTGEPFLGPRHLEPFIEDRPEFNNDFYDLYMVNVPAAFMKNLASALLRQTGLDSTPASPTLVTAIADVCGEAARAGSHRCEPRVIAAALAASVDSLTGGHYQAHEYVSYVALNMGAPEAPRRPKEASAPQKGKRA